MKTKLFEKKNLIFSEIIKNSKLIIIIMKNSKLLLLLIVN